MVRDCNPMLFCGDNLALGQEHPAAEGDPRQQLADAHMPQISLLACFFLIHKS